MHYSIIVYLRAVSFEARAQGLYKPGRQMLPRLVFCLEDGYNNFTA